ncbi:hypothetical protein [Pseudonocardia xinjiangensis]|uniref:hypothetical protein n=1 Tax=Pseudonocardia xinjiangensis TaxID=75289 RepID=UPI00146BC647|nr:hypothetical protein [Pseudonocardia xinjiangensis]
MTDDVLEATGEGPGSEMRANNRPPERAEQLEPARARRSGPPRAAPSPPVRGPDAILMLQRAVGNRAVADLLTGGATTQQSTAVQRVPTLRPEHARVRAHAVEQQRIWSVLFGTADPYRGASSVLVELGPGIDTPGVYGSTPGPRENRAVNDLNAAGSAAADALTGRAGTRFIKGHLLNSNLGGPGVSANLTPMTLQANAQYHVHVERPVKIALTQARRHAEFYERDAEHWLGVEFTANVRGQKFPHGSAAERAVADHIDVFANWITKPKHGGETDFLSPAERDQLGLPDLPNGRFDPITGGPLS